MIKIEYSNELFSFIETDDYTRRKLYNFFSILEPGYYYIPAYKMGYWNGKRNLYNGSNMIHNGLIPYVEKYCEKNNIDYEDNRKLNENCISKEDVEEYIKGLKIPLDIRDYQIDTVYNCVKYNKLVVSSPTSSGKSLMIYIITRWMQDHKRANNKILIIVPSKILVKQMYDDFKSYSKESNWKVEDNCNRISSDFVKDFSKDIIITTYQSIYKNSYKDFFKHFEGLILDECHGAQSYTDKKSKCLHTILNNCIDTRFRYGFTGTFPEDKLYALTLLKFFDRKYDSVDYNTLLQNNWISDFQVNCIKINHFINRNGQTYRDELNSIYESKTRNKFLLNLLYNNKNNQLLLFKEIQKHAKKIYEMISNDDRFNDRQVIILDKESSVKDRDKVKDLIKDNNNVIVLATYKLLGTGWSVNNLHHIIFAAPLKSKQSLLQSIGRGLRLLKNSNKVCKIWDLIDKFLYSNVLYKQWLLREKYYNDSGFKVKTVELKNE